MVSERNEKIGYQLTEYSPVAFLSDSDLPMEKSLAIPTSNSSTKVSKKKHMNSTIADDKSSSDDPLSFIICPICTPDEPDSEPQMVLKAKWQDHIRGKVHKNAMYKRGILQRSGPDQSEEAQKKRETRQAAAAAAAAHIAH